MGVCEHCMFLAQSMQGDSSSLDLMAAPALPRRALPLSAGSGRYGSPGAGTDVYDIELEAEDDARVWQQQQRQQEHGEEEVVAGHHGHYGGEAEEQPRDWPPVLGPRAETGAGAGAAGAGPSWRSGDLEVWGDGGSWWVLRRPVHTCCAAVPAELPVALIATRYGSCCLVHEM